MVVSYPISEVTVIPAGIVMQYLMLLLFSNSIIVRMLFVMDEIGIVTKLDFYLKIILL